MNDSQLIWEAYLTEEGSDIIPGDNGIKGFIYPDGSDFHGSGTHEQAAIDIDKKVWSDPTINDPSGALLDRGYILLDNSGDGKLLMTARKLNSIKIAIKYVDNHSPGGLVAYEQIWGEYGTGNDFYSFTVDLNTREINVSR